LVLSKLDLKIACGTGKRTLAVRMLARGESRERCTDPRASWGVLLGQEKEKEK